MKKEILDQSETFTVVGHSGGQQQQGTGTILRQDTPLGRTGEDLEQDENYSSNGKNGKRRKTK